VARTAVSENLAGSEMLEALIREAFELEMILDFNENASSSASSSWSEGL